MRLRLSHTGVGTVLSVAAAVIVTAQAMNAPPKPYKARDIVAPNPVMFTDACVMYPAECRFEADGTVSRIVGRRIVPGAHGEMLQHFGTKIGAVQEQSWDATEHASNNAND